MMDLSRVLSATLNADPIIRHEAERSLSSYLKDGGLTEAILFECFELVEHELAEGTGSSNSVAVIYLKNLMRNYGNLNLSETKREATRRKLFYLISHSRNGHLTLALCLSLQYVLAADYASYSAAILKDISGLLCDSRYEQVFTGILALLEAAKLRCDRPDEFASFQPTLLSLAQRLIPEVHSTQLAAEMMWKILKIHYHLMSSRLPREYLEHNKLATWLHVYLELIVKDASRCRKWSLRIINLLFIYYAEPQEHEDDHTLARVTRVKIPAFSKMFIDYVAGEICRVYLEQIESDTRWQGFTPQDKFSLFEYMKFGLGVPQIQVQILPKLDRFLALILSGISLTEDELNLFEENEIGEFMARQDPTDDDTSSIRLAAGSLLKGFADSPQLSQPFTAALINYIDHMTRPAASDIDKDCALKVMIQIPRHPLIHDCQVFILERVVPMLNGRNFLIARVFEFVTVFPSAICGHSTVNTFYTKACDEFDSRFLMLQIRSIQAIKALLLDRTIRERHRAQANRTVDKMLLIANEVRSDVFFEGTLEDFFHIYMEELAPHALHLFQQLSDQFMELSGNDEGSDLAGNILSTFSSVICSLERQDGVLEEAAELIVPVVTKALTLGDLSCIDEALDVVDCTMTSRGNVPSHFWPLFLTILKMLRDEEGEFISEDAYPILGMFVYYGANVFQTHEAYLDLLFRCIERTLFAYFQDFTLANVYACSVTTIALICLHGDAMRQRARRLAAQIIRLDYSNCPKSIAFRYCDVLCAIVAYDAEALISLSSEQLAKVIAMWRSSDSLRESSQKIQLLAVLSLLRHSDAAAHLGTHMEVLFQKAVPPFLIYRPQNSFDGKTMFVSEMPFSEPIDDSEGELLTLQLCLDRIDSQVIYADTMRQLSHEHPDVYRRLESLLSDEHLQAHKMICTHV